MRSVVIDCIGKRFGSLVVMSRDQNDKYGKATWKCVCDCGNESIVPGCSLRCGNTTTCGKCRGVDLSGKRFGRWVVLDRVKRVAKKGDSWLWNCICDCGNEKTVSSRQLIVGSSKSCGCLRKEVYKEPKFNRRIGTDREATIRKLRKQYERAAAKRCLSWELSNIQFEEIIGRPCSYCGEPPKTMRSHRKFGSNVRANGIDRVDSSKGYSLDNCLPSCFDCNHSKSDDSLEDFLAHAKRIAIHQGWITPDPITSTTSDMSLKWTVM